MHFPLRPVTVFLLLWATTAPALELDGNFVQGGLIRGKAAPGSRVTLSQKALRVSAEGWFLVGFGRDAKSEMTLVVTDANGAVEKRVLRVKVRKYDVQRIDGLPPGKVTPSAQDLKRIRRENAMIGKARIKDLPEVDFVQEFQWPATGRISGVFGSQRILNGKPRRPHYGVDVAAPRGTPVRAPATGTVSLVHQDMYFTGGTIMMDHGHGLSSLFIHLSKIHVTSGQRMERGDTIGEIGSTGRATGPHLHWGMSWFRQRLDPQLVVGPMRAQ